VSRAAAELTEDLGNKLIVWISNSKGAVRKYNNGGSNALPQTGIDLVSGSYVAEAWTGDSVSAAWDKKYYKARQEFAITSGSTTNVDLVCTVANSVVSVVYTDEVKELLSDRSITVNHSRGELTFDDEQASDKAYFMLPTIEDESGNKVKETTLHWSLSGKRLNNTDVFKSGDITDVKPATEYILTVKYNDKYANDEIGGGYFTVEVKEEPLTTVENEFEITAGPRIEGYDSYEDLSVPVYAESGKVGKKSIFASISGTEFKEFSINSEVIKKVIPSTSVNLIGLSDADLKVLEAGGINYSSQVNTEKNYAWIKLNFSADLLNSLDEGDYPITVTVTDDQGRTSTATLDIYISDSPLVTDAVAAADVWAHHTTLTATVTKPEKITTAGIKYRKVGTQTWTDATSSLSGTTLTANLTGLEAGTQYEYVSFNGSTINSDTKTFTTETESQLPNASFEEGYQDGKVYRFYPEGGEMFWDSGNEGSASLSASSNTTSRSTDKVVDGTYSLKMETKSVFTVLAAGSVFAGQFLGISGTNGILGWGRDWTSRPAKLKGYLHYTPAKVNKTASESPLTTNDYDNGIIYVALLDNSVSKTYNGSKPFPVIVNTSTKEFFSKTDSNVIAYGEKVLTSATSGDAMVEFEIPLEYSRTAVIPSYIILTCSASRYGDYFAGGVGSVLYVDNLQLVYE
jgi:hypothetical protein